LIASSDAAPALREATQAFFAQAVTNGQAKSWVAVADGAVVAAGTLAIFCRPPHLGNLSGREAYLLNMYTVPACRRGGIASKLLGAITEYAKSQGFGKVWLHATADGRPIYERFGFAPNPAEMEWVPSAPLSAT
jgi:GNAT superfamily N-acetyltransferase